MKQQKKPLRYRIEILNVYFLYDNSHEYYIGLINGIAAIKRSYEMTKGPCEWQDIIKHLELDFEFKFLAQVFKNDAYLKGYDIAKIKDCLGWNMYSIDEQFWNDTKPLIVKSKPIEIIKKNKKQKKNNEYPLFWKKQFWDKNPELEEYWYGVPGPPDENGVFKMIKPPIEKAV